jgi:hypothetical protein
MTRQKALNSLSIIWVSVLFPTALILAVQTIAGKYGEDGELAWSWFLIQTSPIVSLLVAAIFASPSQQWCNAPADRLRFGCAVGVSLIQGISMLVVLLIEPTLQLDQFELFDRTVLFLALVQGVGVAAVGAVVFDGR